MSWKPLEGTIQNVDNRVRVSLRLIQVNFGIANGLGNEVRTGSSSDRVNQSAPGRVNDPVATAPGSDFVT